MTANTNPRDLGPIPWLAVACLAATPAMAQLYVDAGEDQTVALGETVSLSGTAIDFSYGMYSWIWILTDPNGATTLHVDNTFQFVAEMPGEYVAEFQGCNAILECATDTAIITVTATCDPVDMILDLIAQVVALNLVQGIENSLDAKLDAALGTLDDVNENNDVAATNSLNALISAVEAQSGNKITVEDADALIAAAQEIIDCLSGGD